LTNDAMTAHAFGQAMGHPGHPIFGLLKGPHSYMKQVISVLLSKRAYEDLGSFALFPGRGKRHAVAHRPSGLARLLGAFLEDRLMRYYPVNLDVRRRNCLVVGGGSVAERKVRTLLECEAQITVITLGATETLRTIWQDGRIELVFKGYQSSDLDGRFLVIGATDDEQVNQAVSRDCASRCILCNIADRPEVCTFVLPAIMCRGDLVIAVSTSNKSPAVAKYIRQAMEKEFGPEYATLLNLMGAIRQRFMAEAKSPEAHKDLFGRLLAEGLVEMIREERREDVDALLEKVLGNGYTWNDLMTSH
jgi:precorrin-2 dehydrogenase/sirohydrochlorin ferrochelatase